MIATKAATEVICHRGIMDFCGVKTSAPTVILTDSTAAVMLADSSTNSKRMKHIATRLAFLREQIAAKVIMMFHISNKGQVADIFTKPLTPALFHALRGYLLGPR